MAVLDTTVLPSVGTSEQLIKRILAAEFWIWYTEHSDLILFRRWIFTVRVRDVHQLFVILFGPEPRR